MSPARAVTDQAESAKLVALRKALGGGAEKLPHENQKQAAEDAIQKILTAFKDGVCRPDPWEMRCLAAAISNIRGGRFEQARSLARRALWPEENRRDSAIPRFVL